MFPHSPARTMRVIHPQHRGGWTHHRLASCHVSSGSRILHTPTRCLSLKNQTSEGDVDDPDEVLPLTGRLKSFTTRVLLNAPKLQTAVYSTFSICCRPYFVTIATTDTTKENHLESNSDDMKTLNYLNTTNKQTTSIMYERNVSDIFSANKQTLWY